MGAGLRKSFQNDQRFHINFRCTRAAFLLCCPIIKLPKLICFSNISPDVRAIQRMPGWSFASRIFQPMVLMAIAVKEDAGAACTFLLTVILSIFTETTGDAQASATMSVSDATQHWRYALSAICLAASAIIQSPYLLFLRGSRSGCSSGETGSKRHGRLHAKDTSIPDSWRLS
jgi:hypothetical protein